MSFTYDGFGLGSQTVQVLLGEAFFGTVTSWGVGFFVAVIFAVLSYLIYIIGVALIAGGLDYGLAIALLGAIGFFLNAVTWIVAVIADVILAVVTLRFNIQKYVIIIATGLGGAADLTRAVTPKWWQTV